MADLEEKIEATIQTLKASGHIVETREEGAWFEIDRRMLVSLEEIRNLVDGVYSLPELEELFVLRRMKEAGERPDMFANDLLRAGSRYFELGYAGALPQELTDRALGYLNAKQNLANERRSRLIEQQAGQPVPGVSLEPAIARERASREDFLGAYRDYLGQKRIQMAAKG